MVKKSETAIYEPPKKGFPFLAVTLVKDDVTAVPVPSRKDARNYLSELRQNRDKKDKKRETSGAR